MMTLSDRLLSHAVYLGIGIVSLLLALFLATRVLRPAFSQSEAVPAPAEIPAGQVPAVLPGSTAPALPTSANSEATTARPAEIPSDVSFLEPYVFDLREGRRNPFRSPPKADGSAPNIMLPGAPLERYELDEIKLVGIMWDVNAPKAMFVDPQGEMHILAKDDRIGRKRGYIAVIREGEVVVVEMTSFGGENAFSTRVLRLDR